MNKSRHNFSLMFAAVLPITLFLAFWWGSVGHVASNNIFKLAFLGLILGLVLAKFAYKTIYESIYDYPISGLASVYVFYSICIFGFFMGVPIFNLLLGIPAGAYIAHRLKNKSADEKQMVKGIAKTARFTAYVMIFVCLSSAYFALTDKTTAANLEGMFSLGFHITQTMLWVGTVIGGLALVYLQYLITQKTAEKTLKKIKTNQKG